ncbi:MAG: hypothetical protein LBU43_02875 [Candidatus Accumulibacter sp.]|nr:hypothetical protein [Accumulibacter sp.]
MVRQIALEETRMLAAKLMAEGDAPKKVAASFGYAPELNPEQKTFRPGFSSHRPKWRGFKPELVLR